MKKNERNNREKAWILISELYLDNELTSSQRKVLQANLLKLVSDISELRRIDREEVFPVLYQNILSPAGIWTAFDPDWLVREIKNKRIKRNLLQRWWHGILYTFLMKENKKFWNEME